MAGARIKGDGSIYQRNDGLWIAALDRGYKPDGTRDRWTGASRTEDGALVKLRKARAERDSGGVITTATTTVSGWLDEWLTEIARPVVRPKTYRDYERCVRLHIKPRIGKAKLAQLTPQQVRRMERDIARDKTPATAKSVHVTLHAALNDAITEGRITRNPAAAVTPPTVTRDEREPMTTANARRIIAKTAGTTRGLRWHLALMTGGRSGEVLGLEIDRITLYPMKNGKETGGEVEIDWQLQRLPYDHGCVTAGQEPTCGRKRGGNCPDRKLIVPDGFEMRPIAGSSLVLTRPKTNSSVRTLPIEPGLAGAIRAHRKSLKRISGLLFTDDRGLPIDPKNDDAEWDDLLDTMKIPRVRRHDVRHTTASLLLEDGVDPKVVQELFGHAHVATTREYQHVSMELKREAVGGLGKRLN